MRAFIPLPIGERVDRPQGETDEGDAKDKHKRSWGATASGVRAPSSPQWGEEQDSPYSAAVASFSQSWTLPFTSGPISFHTR